LSEGDPSFRKHQDKVPTGVRIRGSSSPNTLPAAGGKVHLPARGADDGLIRPIITQVFGGASLHLQAHIPTAKNEAGHGT
jgi:hypothetical protein